MPIVRCPTPADATTALANLRSQDGSALFLFFGSQQEATGQSWCPDCVTADPVLRAAITKLRRDLTLYECPVGERAAWKNQPGHPYRLDPAFHLARIPTLILFVAGCEQGRLVEQDCADLALVEAFLARPGATAPQGSER